MNFTIGSIGFSFRGAGLYYLHDKKPEGAKQYLSTAERVAWTETRNLLDVGPHTAIRRMIDTAERADELKAAAGVKAGGRKAGGSVFTFSLNWHPDELPNRDRETMIRAAEGALKTLGLDHLQCLMVCHDDEPQPHVHLIVNRVDFNTGKTTPIDKARYHHLDEFCHYETAPEFRHLSPDRAAKYAARERGMELEPDREKRKAHCRKKREKLDAEPARSEKQKLFRETKEQRKRHRDDRSRLDARPRSPVTIDKDAIKQTWRDDMRPAREAMGARHKAEWRTFGATERAFLGGLANAITLSERAGVGEGQFWSSVGALWFGGRNARADLLRQLQKAERKEFNDRAYTVLIDRFTAARKAAYPAKARELTERITSKAIMNARQREERRRNIDQWKEFKNRREAVRRVEKARDVWRAAAEAAKAPPSSPMRDVWSGASKGRSIERKPDRSPERPRDHGPER